MRSLLVAAALCLPGVAIAQAVRSISLAAPNAQLDHEFARVESIRELKDGRVLVSDPGDRPLVVVDFRNGSVVNVSRQGRGPGEFARASTLYALSADSTIMSDGGNRRWLLFDGDHVAVTVPPDNPAILAAQGRVAGADTAGHVFTWRQAPPKAGFSTIGKDDSTTLLLVSRARATVDTIGAARRQPGSMEAQYNPNGNLWSTRFRFNPVDAGEKFILLRDGWLAVARVEPYRVDWRAPNGKWTLGSRLPFPAIRASEREKDAVMARIANRDNRPVAPWSTIAGWPETLPAFDQLAPLLDANDGRILIRHQASAGHEDTVYDVVNRSGQLDGQLTLPASEHIVGFGAASVYVVVVDNDGIQRLRRHPWNTK